MFDPGKLQAKFESDEANFSSLDSLLDALPHYSPAELLQLRNAINKLLPRRSLSQINMEEELVLQLQTAQDLIYDTLQDEGTPANQKAQVVNACTAIIAQLVKLQVDLFNAERVKNMEHALIKAVAGLPPEAVERFFASYEASYSGTESAGDS